MLFLNIIFFSYASDGFECKNGIINFNNYDDFKKNNERKIGKRPKKWWVNNQDLVESLKTMDSLSASYKYNVTMPTLRYIAKQFNIKFLHSHKNYTKKQIENFFLLLEETNNKSLSAHLSGIKLGSIQKIIKEKHNY